LIVFLAELSNLELWEADVGIAYLESNTKEKVYIIGGPEFVPLEGHTLLIFKTLYGLRPSTAYVGINTFPMYFEHEDLIRPESRLKYGCVRKMDSMSVLRCSLTSC
jgi:hypothetical protein